MRPGPQAVHDLEPFLHFSSTTPSEMVFCKFSLFPDFAWFLLSVPPANFESELWHLQNDIHGRLRPAPLKNSASLKGGAGHFNTLGIALGLSIKGISLHKL